MLETILETLKIMGWLGLILLILSSVNIITGTLFNIWENKEKFSWNKMLKGIEKVLIFYGGAIALSVAFTILPYINQMIIDNFGTTLIQDETLKTLSSVAVLGTVVAAIITQGKKAIIGISKLANISSEVQTLGEPEEIEEVTLANVEELGETVEEEVE